MTQTGPALTPDSAERALREACQVADLDCESASLIRMGENAMFRLQRDVMARVGRSEEASRKEIRIAAWLETADFPAVRLARQAPQPVLACGFAVTFWEFIRESNEPVEYQDLGEILRQLHNLPSNDTLALPQFEPFPKVAARLDRANGIPDADLSFLRNRSIELEAKFEELDFVLPLGPIHGDAHNGNLMRDENGIVRLIDFEDFAFGPREWDVAVAAVRYKAFGWLDKASYAAYVRAYGFDPTKWAGFPVLRAIRELNMTTWLMQRMGETDELDAEILHRISDLRNEQLPRQWGIY
ncbi:Phosphotransferase enzyme family protein [Amycolatopsis tolypomycina]|uniref:Phosphotransferase enzyme family protein n=1 Tax=Amycolatopsis tolypomycina TaxID=208445 RepID=A0A1H4JS21_9PSEU|nr:aminoglycoside phosphotransferase family protein [Amycolatopsis tolypomycina]SEB28786.1 Phosphotransferase enzyme family protein [Amycolatopsis tolypomycina]SEB49063.1 Phosphotransferase enzyme family protein [Amycolatopsis tolypomycina]